MDQTAANLNYESRLAAAAEYRPARWVVAICTIHPLLIMLLMAVGLVVDRVQLHRWPNANGVTQNGSAWSEWLAGPIVFLLFAQLPSIVVHLPTSIYIAFNGKSRWDRLSPLTLLVWPLIAGWYVFDPVGAVAYLFD